MTARQLVMSLKQVVSGDRDITLVIHEDDESGGWQFLTSDNWETEDLLLVHVDHLEAGDESLRELRSLPLGRFAMRSSVDSAWVFGPISDIPTL